MFIHAVLARSTLSVSWLMILGPWILVSWILGSWDLWCVALLVLLHYVQCSALWPLVLDTTCMGSCIGEHSGPIY